MNTRTPIFNPEAHKYIKVALAEKMYKLQNKEGWEIYFRPLTDRSIEVITFFQGKPHVNPKNFGDGNAINKEYNNIEVWSATEARDSWKDWVEHHKFEKVKVEDFLRGGRSEWAGESFNYRKESKSASWCIPEDGNGNV